MRRAYATPHATLPRASAGWLMVEGAPADRDGRDVTRYSGPVRREPGPARGSPDAHPPMARCRIDKSIERVEIDGFAFPLGAYPVEKMSPRPGYTVDFEQADGGETDRAGRGVEDGYAPDDDFDAEDEPGEFGGTAERPGRRETGAREGADDDAGGEWEEWPDRYVFDILVSATRVEALCRALFALLPGRVYPILDFLGMDEYREVDPYVSYDLIGLDRFLDATRRYRAFFFEDGLVGFGAMSEEPFIYIFVDEHKIVTVRVETALKERVEAVLQAFDLEEVDEIRGADAATHEHRGVLDAPPDRADLRTAEEIVEELRDEWRLVLNIDTSINLDEDGNELGITGWRCVVRYEPPPPPDAPPDAEAPPFRYAEMLLTADCLNMAEDMALSAMDALVATEQDRAGSKSGMADGGEENVVPATVVLAERLRPENFERVCREIAKRKPSPGECEVVYAAWLAG